MKRAAKFMAAMLMLVTMAFSLVACGGSDAAGTYVITEMAGVSVDALIQQYKEAGLGDVNAENLSKLVLGSDGTFTITAQGESDTKGTYTQSGSTLKLTVDGDTAEGTLSDGVLSISMGGVAMKYKKK